MIRAMNYHNLQGARQHADYSMTYLELMNSGNLRQLFDSESRHQIIFDPYSNNWNLNFPQPIRNAVPSEYTLFKLSFRGQPEVLYESWQREQRIAERMSYWSLLKRHLEAEQQYQIGKGWIYLRREENLEDEGFDDVIV